MKKKVFLIFSLILCMFLASCKNNTAVVKLNDNADPEVYELLKLNVLENGVSINPNLDKNSKNYINVILPEDANEALVTRSVVIDEALKDMRVKDINAAALTFVTGVSAEYQTSIMSELYNKEYGITKEKLGLSVDLLKGTSFSVKVDSKIALDYYNEGKTNITLSVIYLPTRVIIVNNSTTVADITVLVPVYAEFSLGEVSDVFKAVRTVSFELNEDGSLPKKSN